MSVTALRTTRDTGAAEGLLAQVRALGRTKVFQIGDSLFEQADPCTSLYLLEDGLVGLRKLDEDGATMLVNLARPGDYIGYGPLLSGGEHLTSAEALRPCRITIIDAGAARRLMRERPDFLGALLRQTTRDLQALENKYLQMATRQAHERLASLLLSLNTLSGSDAVQSDCRFEVPLMNKDIADLIGIRPETLSRAIGHLRATGLAELRDHVVHIPSLARLAQLGCGGHSQIAA